MKPPSKRKHLLRQLHTRLRELQRKNLFISNAYSTGLTLLESHLLVELDSSSEWTPSALATQLGVHKVGISRSLQSLEKMGYLKSRRSKSDRRSKFFSLSSKGKKALRLLDTNANQMMEEFCVMLSQPEQGNLATLWEKLCDGLLAPTVQHRSGVHPLLVPGRRQSRAMGLLGTSVFGVEGTSSLEWHTLWLIRDGLCTTATELASALQLIPATAIGVIRRLMREKLITGKTHPTDGRSQLLSISEAGLDLLNKIEIRAIEQLNEACQNFSPRELSDLLELFTRFGADLQKKTSVMIRPGIAVGVCRNEEDLQRARTFLIEQLVAQSLHKSAVDVLCHKSSAVIVLEENGTVQAVLEFNAPDAQVLYALAIPSVSAALLKDFLLLAKQYCKGVSGTSPLARPGGFSQIIANMW